MEEVVIVGGARTPIGDFLGSLKDVSAVELGTVAVKAALERAGVEQYTLEHHKNHRRESMPNDRYYYPAPKKRSTWRPILHHQLCLGLTYLLEWFVDKFTPFRFARSPREYEGEVQENGHRKGSVIGNSFDNNSLPNFSFPFMVRYAIIIKKMNDYSFIVISA